MKRFALFISAILLTIIAWLSIHAEPREAQHMKLRSLTPEEERVIVHKGTEPPFSGIYTDHHEQGLYRCKRCGEALFRSEDKFDSHCGWPSFDNAIPDAVKEQPDADGKRTEIVCAKCGAHLGHVFKGEGLTAKNVRHCVNSVSLDFEAPTPVTENAYFAGGCFWGVEYHFDKLPGVLKAESGYMGGSKEDPTYKQVCTGATGHAETVHIVFNPMEISYENLAKLFFEIHDPTQANRQGPDVGTQYRSAIFYESEDQKKTAETLVERLRAKGLDVKTELLPAGVFWPAEDYHQDYYFRNGKEPYCHSRVKRF